MTILIHRTEQISRIGSGSTENASGSIDEPHWLARNLECTALGYESEHVDPAYAPGRFEASTSVNVSQDVDLEPDRGRTGPQLAVGYVRVSTEAQAVDGVSLEAQRSRIEAWCLANGYELASLHGRWDLWEAGGQPPRRTRGP